jgi:hypothetical protein
MKKFNTVPVAAIADYLNSDAVVSLVAKSKKDEPLFLVQLLPLRDMGLFMYSDSSDKRAQVPCVVEQSRYSLADNYKIELVPTVPGFGRQSYYLTDFAQMLREGDFAVINQQSPEFIEPTGFVGFVYRINERLDRQREEAQASEGLAELKRRAVRRFGKLFGQASTVRF